MQVKDNKLQVYCLQGGKTDCEGIKQILSGSMEVDSFIDSLGDSQEKELWGFMHHRDDTSEVLRLLGYDRSAIIAGTHALIGGEGQDETQPKSQHPKKKKKQQLAKLDDAEDFFNQLGAGTVPQVVQPVVSPVVSQPAMASQVEKLVVRSTNFSQGNEKLIKDTILMGMYSEAVACLMRTGRYTEALILA